jgi:hypothetical protein
MVKMISGIEQVRLEPLGKLLRITGRLPAWIGRSDIPALEFLNP